MYTLLLILYNNTICHSMKLSTTLFSKSGRYWIFNMTRERQNAQTFKTSIKLFISQTFHTLKMADHLPPIFKDHGNPTPP